MHLPSHHPDALDVPDPMALYRAGRITDLTGEEKAALDVGADIFQVVNARRGTYVAGGREYTREGTTRRGIAGARLIARAIDRAQGAAPGGVYANFTVDRLDAARAQDRYGRVLARGLPFQRRAPLGGTQTVAYRYAAAPRQSVSTILRTSTSRDDTLRQLVNNGYLLHAPEGLDRRTAG